MKIHVVTAVLAASLAGAGSVVAGPHDHHHGAAPAAVDEGAASPAPGSGPPDAPATDASAHSMMGFEVGTAVRPLIARGVRGPLSVAFVRAGQSTDVSHVDAALLARAGAEPAVRAGADPVATRTALTKAQATKQLSKACRKLVNAKRPSKLGKKDRKKRTACLEQRRKLIEASKGPKGTTSPGVSAPAAPIQGPAPTTSPVVGPPPHVPAPTTPTGTTPTGTTPTKPKPTWEPCEPSSPVIGVVSFDAFKQYTLTRACADAGNVTFNFSNVDNSGSFPHNLYIAPVDARGEVSGPLVKIIGEIPDGESASATVALAAGRYLLICTVPGHEGMNTPFQVYD